MTPREQRALRRHEKTKQMKKSKKMLDKVQLEQFLILEEKYGHVRKHCECELIKYVAAALGLHQQFSLKSTEEQDNIQREIWLKVYSSLGTEIKKVLA